MSDLHAQVMTWMAKGERGMSSETMAFRFLGIERNPHDERAPSDPDDLRRCLLLLMAVPTARLHMDKLRPVSATWDSMVDRWDELEASFLEETDGTLYPKFGTNCPKTYALMQRIQYGERHVPTPGLHISISTE